MKLITTFLTIITLLTTSCRYQNFSKESPLIKKQYVLGSDDIPLFNGLKLIEEESSTFDSTTGNIVISTYVNNSTNKAVTDFYKKTLPQLGWKISTITNNTILFVRDGDRLEITTDNIKLTMHFFISSTTN